MQRGRGQDFLVGQRRTRGRPRKRPENCFHSTNIQCFDFYEQVGSNPADDTSIAGSHGNSPSSASSYRNQGGLSINSATDLSTSSTTILSVPGTQAQAAIGFSSRNSSSTTPSTQDVCIGTSVGTVTEPDCLGPCEPGTSVTLEGIVWHETESGKESLFKIIFFMLKYLTFVIYVYFFEF